MFDDDVKCGLEGTRKKRWNNVLVKVTKLC